ncbi:hypothetical protein DM860_017473 [Cuscuta australis]|uniref:F-box associated domain-containing protein n=1 Tax=Cuscuta australis TaxID=267555 RepID=A0A328DW97_9ASTE|nr:hypothetical protein DM860_017473 [Cuscuta australis]
MKGEWNEAPYLSETRFDYYFFAANDKIYALGMYEGYSFGCYSFDLKCLDCNGLAKGWQSIHPISKEHSHSQIGLMVIAFKLDYETTADPATGYIKRHDKRAVLFTWTERISFDFVKNEFKVSRDHIKDPLSCLGGVGHGNLIYFLFNEDPEERANLMV